MRALAIPVAAPADDSLATQNMAAALVRIWRFGYPAQRARVD
jgi:hypothetical protein